MVCAILGIGLVALARGALSEAPFSIDARVAGPDGRVFWGPDLITMMNAGAYRQAAGRAFLLAAGTEAGAARSARLEEAGALFQEAIDLRPLQPLVRLDLALVRLEQGDAPGALELILKARELAPLNPVVVQERIELAWRLRRFDDPRVHALLIADLEFLRTHRRPVFDLYLRNEPRLADYVERRLSPG